ncbi:OLC1v1032279C1 [Oldenlandia corymbosa var. corymbosa]|uniref:WAT1-related protein n=1 Tax=Oldenlandia corymbosa var. corymbosa TaxID=529605 RepID=A0AAV1CKM7_OLDCO|nr:OLC1v1032279C1 [Oldenlandia corymbosa var. corymbosa]
MGIRDCLDEWKPVLVMLLVDFVLAIVNLLFKKALNEGMNRLVLITYRQGISALFLAPIAYFWERKSWENLTVGLVCGLFFSGLIGASLTPYFVITGIAYTSATYSCAFINVVPVVTFILAILFRQEKLNLRYRSGRSKLLGTIICLGGTLVLVLYKGVPVINATKTVALQKEKHDAHNQAIGSMFLFAGNLTWASWFIVQAQIGKYYPFQYTSTTIMCFFGAILSAILSVMLDRNMSSWLLKGRLQIITVIYSGLVGTGLVYGAFSWCVKKRGPVFTSAFGPFVQVLVAILEVSFLHQQITLGSILGSLVVVVGMYMLLWGKSKEVDLQKSTEADGRKDNGDCNITLPVTKPAAIVSSTNTSTT